MTYPCYEFEGTRYLRNRHNDGCDGTDCAGCQQCGERHCGECSKGVHLGFGENTCPTCVGKCRADLRTIVELAACLPAEAEVRGVHSEAASLNGPYTDPEQLAWKRAAKAKRDDVLISDLMGHPDWADDEHHPAAVLKRFVLSLEEDYADPYDRGDDLASLTDWLDSRLHRVANDVGQDFGQFKREVGRVVRHMEAVLHDSPMGDRANVGCFDCGSPLERRLVTTGFEDVWTCRGCRRRYTYAEYNFALRARLEESA